MTVRVFSSLLDGYPSSQTLSHSSAHACSLPVVDPLTTDHRSSNHQQLTVDDLMITAQMVIMVHRSMVDGSTINS
jgi:hypothetical protein